MKRIPEILINLNQKNKINRLKKMKNVVKNYIIQYITLNNLVKIILINLEDQ